MSIAGKTKTEAMYRAVVMDSSSSLKEFSMNRKKYHKKYILNERVEEEDTKAATIGRVVETLLLEPEEFDNRFYMSTCMSAPTEKMLEFVEALCKHTLAATDEFGNISRSFEEIAKDAYTDSGYKLKFEAVIGKFQGSDAELYYNELRIVKGKGLTIVTTQDVTNAENIVQELKTNFVTADIVNMVESARYSILNQFQIEGYTVNDHLFKSMMDKIVVDHNERTIQVYDLKCTWSVENFYEEYYLYRRAYIQAYLYYAALITLVNNPEHEWYGYVVNQPRFIVCDSTNYISPLIYTLTDSDLMDAYTGFYHKGKFYPGVDKLIKDLKWAIDNDMWNMSRENYLANGLINIKGGK
jgi:hypothetical protein